MRIKWNGHSSFTITASDGTMLVTDPYDPEGYGGVLKYDPVKDHADAALVSHDHADHNYVAGLPGSPKLIRDSDTIKEIQIKGVATHHDESGGSERGANVVFVFSIDGIRICFVGDLGHQLSPEQIRDIGPVDLLLVPVGGTFTVDSSGAVEIVESLSPKLIIPMHYKTDKCDLPLAGVDNFLEKMSRVKQLQKSEIELTSDMLPVSESEVWVPEHAC